MKRAVPFLACLLILASPRLLMACGGCTDAALRMTWPWAGSGILLVWFWVLAAFVMRRIRRDPSTARIVVRGSTFLVFLLLGSVGYIGLVILTAGSFLLPSLLLGFIWLLYLIVRLLRDGC